MIKFLCNTLKLAVNVGGAVTGAIFGTVRKFAAGGEEAPKARDTDRGRAAGTAVVTPSGPVTTSHDGMLIERDVRIPVDDGAVLMADVYRPDSDLEVPVIMTMGPYGKGARYQDHYAPQWEWLVAEHPDILAGSTRSFLTWETVDPDVWVRSGYAVVRVDSRGAGRSPGYLDIFSERETRDFHDCIEWGGTQPWSNGRVGLLGISYYAINQWQVAALQPAHLAAMIPWEGAADHYRDMTHHGGILSNAFFEAWYPRQVLSLQHGNPGGPMDPWLGQRATGPGELTEEELRANRADPFAQMKAHPLDDDFHRRRSPDWSKVTVPFLSAANWGGAGLHARGNFEAFTQAASTEKWLEGHPGRHEEWFYLPYAMALQKRFFDHYLKGEDNGWEKEPRVWMNLRRPFSEEFELRKEGEWPLARTQWTTIHLDGSGDEPRLDWQNPATAGEIRFGALGDQVTLLSPALEYHTEISGPLAAKLFVSSTTRDADLFVTMRAFAADGREVHFQGAVDPETPLAQGWLRASHRKLDPRASRPYRPYHAHGEEQPLEPGAIYELDIEIWPTSIVLPAGYRLGLTVGGRDFERETTTATDAVWTTKGSGPFLHTDPDDRPPGVYAGTTTIHTGDGHDSHLLLPIIPA